MDATEALATAEDHTTDQAQELQETPFDHLSPREYVLVRGAQVHNLKRLSVAIPRNQLVCITGVSGSGKSSLAFDTIYAEGQRMYVESLSAYARQFLGRMEKPAMDYIRGLSPAIAIEQKVTTRNPRSTVGTTTEVYDYLKLLYARIGQTFSPVSGQPVRKDSVDNIVDEMLHASPGTRMLLSAPFFVRQGRKTSAELDLLLQRGFSRVLVKGEMAQIEDMQGLPEKSLPKAADIRILVDRYVAKDEATEEDQFRLSDSVQTAFFEGEGTCFVTAIGGDERTYSDRFELDGMLFEEPSVNLFSFNNPYGACRTCDGFGKVLGIDPDLVFPDRSLSVYDGGIAPWKGEAMRAEFLQPLLKHGVKFDFPIHRAIEELTDEQLRLLWTGNKHFTGLNDFFAELERQTHKIQYRVLLSRFRGKTNCPDCRGTRLRKDAGYVKIAEKSIQDLVLMPLDKLLAHFRTLDLTDYERKVAKQLLQEIESRLQYLNEVGLGYLTLNRLASTLSGGEYQRIKLATSLGSALVGSLYVLDEPSIGLHPRDTTRLVEVLKRLRDVGNTVLVVEHEEEIMRAADQLIDIGPKAGQGGGRLVFQGKVHGAKAVPDALMPLALEASALPSDAHHMAALAAESPTVRYLTGQSRLPVPPSRRPANGYLQVLGAREHNLRNVEARFPLQAFTAVTGVSGSGKSTLVTRILYPALARELGQGAEEIGKFDRLAGDVKRITSVEFVDQNPIGRSSRSNPVTFVKAWDVVRQLYADQPLAKQRGYKPSHYSFNVDGGRCEACQGEGEVLVPMQFMADLWLPCEACQGRRFKQEVLEVEYKGKSASDLLNMTVDQAMAFFADLPKVGDKLKPLQDVGLGYITLGQSSSTLSGGEAQRVKLASFLGKGGAAGRVLFIFDEPTTGLHFADIEKLLASINALVDQGHTVIVIEHNLDMVLAADYVVDLGPEGGTAGGQIIFEGTPEQMLQAGKGHTADYLRRHLAHA